MVDYGSDVCWFYGLLWLITCLCCARLLTTVLFFDNNRTYMGDNVLVGIFGWIAR